MRPNILQDTNNKFQLKLIEPITSEWKTMVEKHKIWMMNVIVKNKNIVTKMEQIRKEKEIIKMLLVTKMGINRRGGLYVNG